MKKQQKINKTVNIGECVLLACTALFLCVLFVVSRRPVPLVSIPAAVPVAASAAAPDTTSDAVPDTAPVATSDAVPDTAPVATSDAVSNPAPVATSDAVPDTAPVATSDAVSNPAPVAMSDAVSNPAPVTTSDAASDTAPVATSDTVPDTASVGTSDTAPVAEPNAGRVNINTADADALRSLPGIGQTLAQRIIDYRDAHGAFTRPDELMNVSGIGQGRFSAIADLICV